LVYFMAIWYNSLVDTKYRQCLFAAFKNDLISSLCIVDDFIRYILAHKRFFEEHSAITFGSNYFE
jgi:hypothetical protein